MKLFKILIVYIYVVLAKGNFLFGEVGNRTENWLSRLYNDKMKGYNKEARPVKDPGNNTTVFIGLYVITIDVDEADQELEVNAWSIMTWTDEHLSWEPKNYMNIDRIHFDQKDIWTPDIGVYNSADSEGVVPFEKVPILTDHLGRMYWFPPTHIRVKCDLDISNWPSDKHECEVRMGSWSHHGEQIDIQVIKNNDTTDVMMSSFEKNNRWDLVDVKARREVIDVDEGQERYIEVKFSFTVQRLARTHATYITTSALVVMVIVLVSYGLPLSSFFSRLILHLFALGILTSCYLTLFTSLPVHGGPVPFVVRYYSGTTVLTLISLLSTIFLTTHTCCDANPSSNLGKRVAGIVASTPALRAVSTPSQQPYDQLETEMAEDVENQSTRTDSSPSNNNIFTASQVRRIINFLLFVLFTVAFFVDYIVLKTVAK